jgi:hypothetical protein
MSFAYAEQQAVVTLPIDRPYQQMMCAESLPNEDGWVTYECLWAWHVAPEGMLEVEQIYEEGIIDSPVKQRIAEIIEQFVGTGEPEVEDEATVEFEVTEEEVVEEEVPELTLEEQALIDFEKCFGGIEQAGAFQQAYSFEKFERKFQRSLDNEDRLAEECVANILLRLQSNLSYPGLVIDEEQGFTETDISLKMSAGIQVDENKLEAEANRITMPSWYVDPYGTCQTEMIEVQGRMIDKCDNRGNEVDFGNAVVNVPNNELTGKTTNEILKAYQFEKAASLLTEQDFINLQAKLDTKVCEIAWDTSGQGGIDITKWPLFLSDGWCNDKVEGFYFKGVMTPLADIIKYKQAQADTEAGEDLRLHK